MSQASPVVGVFALLSWVVLARPGLDNQAPNFFVQFHDHSKKPLTSDAEEWMVMTNQAGTQYNCSLPVISAHETKPDEIALPDPVELFRPFEGQCMFRDEGWWRYELCWPKHLRQYHMEGQKLIAEFYLGLYDPVSSIPTMTDESHLARQGESAVYQSRFGMGTMCDVTRRPREATVLFICAGAGKKMTTLTSLRETATCMYDVIVSTPLVCDKQPLDNSNAPEAEISCYPINESEKSKSRLASSPWAKAVAMDKAARDMHIPEIKYRKGQIIKHKTLNYRGVIVAGDPVCLQTERWSLTNKIDHLLYGRNQPFYHVLIDERDRPNEPISYIAQELLVVEKGTEPIKHAMVDQLFLGFAEGEHIPREGVEIRVLTDDASEFLGAFNEKQEDD
eukprot:c25430_g1_i1.p1 GENE.c25430_g1_i1~~c25430_g1_i1.p1  ORF type:complete len:407 (+),score=87.86 c25430_g1_i1:46-1221(+)